MFRLVVLPCVDYVYSSSSFHVLSPWKLNTQIMVLTVNTVQSCDLEQNLSVKTYSPTVRTSMVLY